MELFYSSGDRTQSIDPAHMTILGAVQNNDEREILAVRAPALLQDFGTDTFLITDFSRQEPITKWAMVRKIPVFLLEYSLQPDGSIDVTKFKPKVLDKGLVILKEC